jgi:hypothetical protein
MSLHRFNPRSNSPGLERLENRRLLSTSAAAAGAAVTAARAADIVSAPLELDSARPHVMLDGAIVAGKSIGAWSAEWWKWAYSFSAGNDPFTDTASPDAHQSGRVFFLAGTAGGSAERTFSVPQGSFVLVPLLVGELSQAELGDFSLFADDVRSAAKGLADVFDSLHATLDGTSIPESELFAHRVVSPVFSFDAVAGNLFGAPAGNSGIAVADGYWLMLSPLSGGTHEINFGGGASAFGFSVDVTDHLSTSPPAASTAAAAPAPAVPAAQPFAAGAPIRADLVSDILADSTATLVHLQL